MKSYQLMIFDWDGTLMDSVGRIISCMQTAARQCDLTIPSAPKVKSIIGLSLSTAMPILFPEASSTVHERLRQIYSEQYKGSDPTPTPLFHGIEGMLRQLHQQNKQLAVATGKSRAGLERVLTVTGLGDVFVTRRGADDAKSKPDPLMLTQILDELQIPVSDAVMVGDSIHDLGMAQAIGMDRIGVCWGVDHRRKLADYAPVFLADQVDELSERLMRP